MLKLLLKISQSVLALTDTYLYLQLQGYKCHQNVLDMGMS